MRFLKKTMENVRKHRYTELVTTDKTRNQLVLEPNYHTTKYFPENLMGIETKKTKVKINKPIYLGMSILNISKTLMYEIWYDYIKPSINRVALNGVALKTEPNYVTWILTTLLFIL